MAVSRSKVRYPADVTAVIIIKRVWRIPSAAVPAQDTTGFLVARNERSCMLTPRRWKNAIVYRNSTCDLSWPYYLQVNGQRYKQIWTVNSAATVPLMPVVNLKLAPSFTAVSYFNHRRTRANVENNLGCRVLHVISIVCKHKHFCRSKVFISYGYHG